MCWCVIPGNRFREFPSVTNSQMHVSHDIITMIYINTPLFFPVQSITGKCSDRCPSFLQGSVGNLALISPRKGYLGPVYALDRELGTMWAANTKKYLFCPYFRQENKNSTEFVVLYPYWRHTKSQHCLTIDAVSTNQITPHWVRMWRRPVWAIPSSKVWGGHVRRAVVQI